MDLVLAPFAFPIGPAPEYPDVGGAVSDGHYMVKYVWPVPSDSDSESDLPGGANHAMYRVPGGPLIPVRRRVVRTQVPRSPDTPIRKSGARTQVQP